MSQCLCSFDLVCSKHSVVQHKKKLAAKIDGLLVLYPTGLSGIADHWPIQRWLSRADSVRRVDTDEGTDSDAWLGAWLRDSLHSADRLARNQVIQCFTLQSCRS